VAQLADLFQRAAECDRECSRINGLAPDGDHRRLLGVELTARGLDRLGQWNVWIAEELRLPFFTRDNGPINAWPPWKSPLAGLTFAVPSGPGPNWHEEIKARNASLAEESQRVAALYEEQQRERQERERREGIAAIEREVVERNRRAGWPYP
jgi:hypothetical protein